MAVVRHAVQGGHGLALRPGRNDHELLARIAAHLIDVDHDLALVREIAQLARNCRDLLHAAPADRHLAAILGRDVEDLLQAGHVRGEGGYDDALLAVLKELFEARPDRLFRRGVSGALDVGRVAHERKHAFLTQLPEARQINHLARGRGQVDLEIACVDERAKRGADGERDRIGDRVVGVDELNRKATQLNHIARLNAVEAHLGGHLMLGELGLDDAAGQARAVNRRVHLAQHIRQAADVILVSVGDEIAAQLLVVALEVGGIRDDQIHAQHVVVRKRQTAVDDDDVVAVFDHGHVLADLIQTAQGYNLQFFFHNSTITFLFTYEVMYFSYIRANPGFSGSAIHRQPSISST